MDKYIYHDLSNRLEGALRHLGSAHQRIETLTQAADMAEAIIRAEAADEEAILRAEIDRLQETLSPDPLQVALDVMRENPLLLEALAEGNSIKTIKTIRSLKGLSVKDAKDFAKTHFFRDR